MRPPCEIVVRRILPAVRSILVRDMTERHDINQAQIADRLGVTQAAVSQYLKHARGDSKLERRLKEAGLYERIQELSDEIGTGTARRSQIIAKFCEFCDSMGKEEFLCVLHREITPFLSDEECDICLSPKERRF